VPDDLVRRLEHLLPAVANATAIGGPVGELLREGVAMRTKLWLGVAAVGLAASGVSVAVAAWPGDDRPKADAPKAAKADEPKADGDKPKKPAKPKLIHTVPVDGLISNPFWGEDGKRLFVSVRTPTSAFSQAAARAYTLRGCWSDPQEKSEKAIPIEFDCSTGGFLGMYDQGKFLAVYYAAGRRINSPEQVQFFEFRIESMKDGVRKIDDRY
jgi:hypothetical protein